MLKELQVRESMSDKQSVAVFVFGIGIAMAGIGFSLVGSLPGQAGSFILEGMVILVIAFGLIFRTWFEKRKKIKEIWGLRKHP